MKYKHILKIFALCLVAVMVSGCGLVNVVNTTVLAKVNGEDVLVSEYMYYLAAVKQQILSLANESNPTDDFWTTTDIEGKKAGEVAKEKALENATTSTLLAQQAKKEGFSADTSDAKSKISNAKANILKQLSGYNLSDSGVELAVTKAYLGGKLLDQYVADGKIVADDAAVEEYYNSSFRTAKHILFITTDPQSNKTVRTDEEAKKLADDTFEKLNNGADFDTLMNELSEDPGLQVYPDGYTFANNGSMTQEFADTTFKLNENEISEPVKVSYGYHIIKRMPLISFETYISQGSTDEEKQKLRSDITDMVISEAENKFIEQWKSEASINVIDTEYNKI